MPKQGFSVITVNNGIKKQLDDLAEKRGVSVPEVIKHLLDQCKVEV